MLLTEQGDRGVYFAKFQTKRAKKKIAGINPPTSISGLILYNYPCMRRHTKEENMVLSLKKLAVLLGGCFPSHSVYQKHLEVGIGRQTL